MDKVIVAFETEKTLTQMCGILEKEGIPVAAACTGGPQVLRAARKYDGGVILCGFKLRDSSAVELFYDIPPGFTLLVLANQGKLEQIEQPEIVKLSAPVHKRDLISAVETILEAGAQRHRAEGRQRSPEEASLIWQAKQYLMDTQGMSEEQAHRYIQKRSMDTGARMVDTARKVLSLSQ